MSVIKNVMPHSHENQDNSGHTHPIADGYFSQKNFTQAKSDKLNNIEANAEVNVNADWNSTGGDAEILNKPTDITDLSGHNANELSDISNAGSGSIITTEERAKLTSVETGATQNDTDANLKSRASHTGEQAISTVTGLQTALDGKVDDSQVLSNVPSNAVFTDTTYIVADNQLSEKNFTTALHTKLTGVEAGATADQTASEIKTAYESNADTNAFTNAEQSKLSGIDASANNYTLPAASGSLGGIVSGSGGDVTVDGSGVVTVLDDSHNHVISNVDGLQAALDAKVDDSQVLANVPANAVFTDTTYSDATTSVSGLMSGADKTKLDGLTGAEVNVNADWNATSGDAEILNKPTTITSAEQAKLGHISVTQAVDLDTMESDIATNTAKVTNATHTGDVTGATALTIANDAVTNAKIANVATGTVKGRTSAGVGDIEDLDIDTTLKNALNLNKTDVGLGSVPNTNCTNASKISSGTLAEARLPTINADNTTISNLEVDNLKAGTLDTDLTAASTSDDTLASAKAIKAYVDANAHVNANWSETDSNSDAFILNKPDTITSSERTKLGHISVTQAVDLDTMESNVASNNAKVTNATHTGDVTGSTELTIANDSVTNAKMANVATLTVKGRTSSGTGNVQDLDIDTTLKDALNLTLDNSAETATKKHFTSSDEAKLNGIESGATADQTDAEIKTAYENNADTNAFTDAEKTKLAGLTGGGGGNVNADWNATSGDAQILNKPSDLTDLSTHNANELADITSAGSGSIITASERTKLNGIESGATADQTQADINALGIDADKVDGLQASQFLRSDAGDTINIGRGAVYFEDNSDDNQNGAGLTIRTSHNPLGGSEGSVGSIFAVRSSGGGLRIWVGQSETTTGINDFVTNDATFNGNISVTGTVDGRDIASDGQKLDKAPFVIWAEESADISTGTGGGFQWSFGNGNLTPNGTGIVLPFSCNLIALSISTEGASTVGVEAYKNTTATGKTINISSPNKSGYSSFEGSPVSYSAGDIFNFKTIAGSTASNGGVVSAWLTRV